MKKTLKVIAGIFLLPVFLCIYFIDRAILVGMFWIQTQSLNNWFKYNIYSTGSIVRVLILLIVYLIYYLITL